MRVRLFHFHKIIFLLLTTGAFLFFTHPAAAYQKEILPRTPAAGDYVIGPGKVEVALNPGQSAIKNLIVTNRYGQDMNFKLEIEDFKGSRTVEEIITLLGQERGPYSLKDYLKPEIRNFRLKHGERITIPVVVEIPRDASPGGLYGAVIVTTQPVFSENETEAAQARGSVRVISRLASLYFVKVNGAVEENGVLKTFETDKKFYNQGPVSFKFLYENNGNVYVNPYGFVRIANFTGAVVDQTSVQPYFVLPDSIRQKEIKSERQFMLGRYTATLYLNRGYKNIIDQKTITFWVLPWKLMVEVFVGLVLAVGLLSWFKKWVNRNFEIRRRG